MQFIVNVMVTLMGAIPGRRSTVISAIGGGVVVILETNNF
jgi:hypothetical protein